MGFGRGEHAGLQGRELLHPPLVWRVEGLVDHLGAAGDVDGELRIGGVAAHDLNPIGYSGGAGAVDHPYGLAAAEQRIEGGETDGAGTEDDVTWQRWSCCAFDLASTGLTAPSGWGRDRSSTYNSRPERAEKVTAPAGAEDGELLLNGDPTSVVTVQPSAHSGGIATAHPHAMARTRG